MPIILKQGTSSSGPSASNIEIARETGDIVIGRAPGSDILLANPMVSRRHCVVSGGPGGWQVADTSASGTLLNGRRIAGSQPLRDGDVITVADTDLTVALPTSVPATAGQSAPATAAPRDPRMNLDSWGRPTGAAPIPPPAHSPAHAPAQALIHAGADSLSQVLAAAGVDRRTLAAPDAALAQALGGLLQACLAGLAQLARDRQQARTDLGVPASPADANPLLQPGSADQVLAALLALPPATARDTLVGAMRELDHHQRATLGAMQGTFAAALDHFAPAAIRKRTSGEAAAWKAYERAFAEKDGFTEVFAQELARSYAALTRS
ncbi:type VI secretion system-associated FHA domain protein [Novosphingobium bradum]|uniref:Type VI secretion system-associated FHA domain protein n=1 Tax=Novosphingobium bradum TaxID=1737444 RepID=A0ABV7IV32_9SPHN